MKPLAAFCALTLLLVGTIGSAEAEAAKRHKRPFCKPRNSHVLKHTGRVRILYVEHPAGEDPYGTPATVYACFPARHRRVELFELASDEAWSPRIMRLTNRYFAVAATTDNVVCEKYQQHGCMTSYVAAYRLSTGKQRCGTRVSATALALTSNGWIAWLGGSTLSACDSAGARALDDGNIDATSVRAAGTTVEWQRDGESKSAVLH